MDKSLRESANISRFDTSSFNTLTMQPPGTPRLPLCKISPNKRSRVCGSRDSGIAVPVICRAEKLADSTVRPILKNASNQTSCCTRSRSGRPTKLTPQDQRAIFQALVVNPKTTAAQLVHGTVPHVKKKTVYRFLKKLGIQKWRCRKRPFLKEEHAHKHLEWAYKHDGKSLNFWSCVC